MISVKYASIIAVVAFVSGSFVASPELRAFAANTVGSADIINNSIQSVDIKDGQVMTNDIAPSAVGSMKIKDNDVRAQDLAPDSVGASELQGVTKLNFVNCSLNNPAVPNGGTTTSDCIVPGAVGTDRVIAGGDQLLFCLDVLFAGVTQPDLVQIMVRNECGNTQNISGKVGLIVFQTT